MATTLAEIKNLLDGLDKKYFSNDAQDMLMMPCRCAERTLHVILDLQEGRFLQLKSKDFDPAPVDGANSGVVFEELLSLNFEMKFVKLGRSSHGEVVGYGDFWIEDGELTAAQLDRILGSFVLGMVEAQERLEVAAATGKTAREREFDEFFKSCIAESEVGVDAEASPNNKQAEAT